MLRDKVHKLKCWTEFFAAIQQGRKTFEIRKNDRDFRVYDWLLLQEWQKAEANPRCRSEVHGEEQEGCICLPGWYTGAELRVEVTYMTDFAQQPGYVVMSIA